MSKSHDFLFGLKKTSVFSINKKGYERLQSQRLGGRKHCQAAGDLW